MAEIEKNTNNESTLNIGIVGLGLIGGSFAKAYHEAGHRVLAEDIDKSVLDFALLAGDIDGVLTDNEIPECDLILICAYPVASAEFLTNKAQIFGKRPVVMDCCGTKKTMNDLGSRLAAEHGFTYVGAHPMAGTEFSGLKYAYANLFKGAPMVIVPGVFDDIEFFEKIRKLLQPAGFGSFSITTAEEHDEIIAFTSQLAHVVSNAYVKSPTARKHSGFSAGSYRDMTRVARLSPSMWSELFLENRVNLVREIDILIENLEEYKDALLAKDGDRLRALLAEGSDTKKEIDG